MKEVESAQPLSSDVVEGAYLPRGESFDLGMVQVNNEDGNLKSRKFIVSMTLIIISSVFTAVGQMDVDTWMFFTGGVAAAYLGVNLYKKRM